ncbi:MULTISPECIES: Bug family tripartite tricarboxylate transporter substrate binding protein [Cupriavidus]|jgi:tripartite-type tricarboxylate transporter receptor subunit TctC|uniref:Tripartite tricarboxylate transporter substrate binding protein n=1 Tax=Cupriavidus metallidurans TaxID=119219 RepID=A0A2L0X132_9BURK|nr:MULTISPECIES: tripartite tricarboxylate transporter substrate binding protein [Cupriavidus]AVA33814.1 tripartite tricarboxylate transporter substrate binding protein [Cupriavidus metallidurans]KWR86413.1 ABC transporter substrate-binding protein [Cupriavidus sp. SHE]QBP12496.1 tripartite tricarboxylate transporter substrate binding protein [Cupriavidus metallidurans]QWC92445.1 tripartite tricarboxylate transporter substrate binding protein [Cupriavidus metallidurans]
MQTSRRTWLAQAGTLAGAAMLGGVGQALAQPSYPSKPIRLVVPYPAGGGTDTVGRMIGQRLAEAWGQPVVVDNKPGASGMLGNDTVAKAAPDGYTVLLAITALIQSPSLYKRMPYDVNKDFTPVSLIAKSSDLFVVPNRVPASTLREFVALAKAGKLSYGSYGNGTSSHLHGELLRQQTGVELTHIPYKGAAPLLNDLLGGQVDSAFVDVTSAYPYLTSGKFKILGITGTQRYKAIPNVPTFAEQGLPGFEPSGWFALFLPANAPKDVTSRMATEVARIVKLPEISQKLAGMGLQPVGSAPQELAAVVSGDMPKWAKIVQDAHIQLD